jgi:hypothetical protein
VEAAANGSLDDSLKQQNAVTVGPIEDSSLAAAVYNADAPYAITKRLTADMVAVQAQQQNSAYDQAGFGPNHVSNSQLSAGQAGVDQRNAPPQPQAQGVGMGAADNNNYSSSNMDAGAAPGGPRVKTVADQKSSSPWYDNVWSAVTTAASDTFGVVDNLTGNTLSATLEGFYKLFGAVLTGPLAAGHSQTDTNQEEWLKKYGSFGSSYGMNAATGAAAAVAGGVIDYAKGITKIAGLPGGSETTQDQAQSATDMRAAGYDPNSAVSRYAYYINDHSSHTIMDPNKVNELKQQFDAHDVELAREAVMAGAAHDPSFDPGGVSPEAQKFLQRAQNSGNDPQAAQLLKEMGSDSGFMGVGDAYASSLGLERGSTARNVVGSVGDLAASWFIDPVAWAGKGAQAVRFLRRGVQDTDSLDRLSQLQAALSKSNEDLSASTTIGSDFSRQLDTDDQVHVARVAGEADPAALAVAAKTYSDYARLYPNQMNQFDTAMGMRSGEISAIRPRTGVEMTTESALSQANNLAPRPFIYDTAAGAEKTPLFSIRDTLGDAADPVKAEAARVDMAQRLGLFMMQDALAQNTKLVNGRLLMPGQATMSARMRAAVAPAIGFFAKGTDKGIGDYLKDPSTVVKFGEDVAPNNMQLLLDRDAGTWVKDNRNGQIGNAVARMADKWTQDWSGKQLSFDSPEGTRMFRSIATSYFPKDMANAMTVEWASRGPGGRSALWDNFQESMFQAGNFKADRGSADMFDNLMKGQVPDGSISTRRQGAGESYTQPMDNLHEMENGKLEASGIMPSQVVANGVLLPNMKDLAALRDRNKVLQLATGAYSNRATNVMTSVMKTGMITNFSNAVRQVGEAVGLPVLADPAHLGEWAKARGDVARATAGARLTGNDTARFRRGLDFNDDEQQLVRRGIRDGDYGAYSRGYEAAAARGGVKVPEGFLKSTFDGGGIAPEDLRTRSAFALNTMVVPDMVRRYRLARAADNPDHTPSLISDYLDKKVGDDLTAGVTKQIGGAAKDYINLPGHLQQMADMSEGIGKGFRATLARVPNSREWETSGLLRHASELTYRLDDPMMGEVAKMLAHEQLAGPRAEALAGAQYATHLAAAPTADARILSIRRQRVADQRALRDARQNGGDVGAAQQALRESNSELEAAQHRYAGEQMAANPASARVSAMDDYLQGKAKRTFEDRPDVQQLRITASGADVNKALEAKDQLAALQKTALSDAVGTHPDAKSAIVDMLINGPEGDLMRRNARRMQVVGGQKVGDDPELLKQAANGLAEVQIRDMGYHLGLTPSPDGTGHMVADEALHPMLQKIVDGEAVGLNTLKEIPEELRPQSFSTPVWSADLENVKGQGLDTKIINVASKAYSFAVAKPLESVASQPNFIVYKRQAYEALEPTMQGLIDNHGITPDVAAWLLETSANKYALQGVFRSSDNPHEMSKFSALTDNFLLFHRAAEDFIRRFSRQVAADPQVLSRGYLMVEAGLHSGMLYVQPINAGDGPGGGVTNRMMFTYPGSELAAKVITDAGTKLGWGQSDLLARPFYAGLNSQVRFINPGLTNPFGFSASPLIGMPLRFMRSIMPASQTHNWDNLITMASGGDPSFTQRSLWQSLLPAPIQRFVQAVDGSNEGQLASATRNAIMYAEMAGTIPGSKRDAQGNLIPATNEEIQQAHDAIAQQTQNVMVMRALTGVLLPASPTVGDQQASQGLTKNTLANLQGLGNLKNEWFQVLADASAKYPTDQAFSEANAEWMRRYPKGSSIVNPMAISVGTTQIPGTNNKSIPASTAVTDFLINHEGFATKSKSLLPYLMPTLGGDFNTTAERIQLRTGIREHKSTEQFYADASYAVGSSDYYDVLNKRSQLIAAAKQAGQDPAPIYTEFSQWEAGWKQANPMVSAEMDKRRNPAYVHSELAPALGAALAGDLPPEINNIRPELQRMNDGYNAYRAQMLAVPGTDRTSSNKRSSINKAYRDAGNAAFLNTPAQSLWKAFGVYES